MTNRELTEESESADWSVGEVGKKIDAVSCTNFDTDFKINYRTDIG